MSKKVKKVIYLGIMGFLTSTTISACYWQTNRYYQSRARWDLIAKELSKKQPDSIQLLPQSDLFALKYVQVEAKMGQQVFMISRVKEGRVGYLIVRALEYKNGEGANQAILAVEGWIPEQYQEYKPRTTTGVFKGILREKQKSDYIHQKIKQQDLDKYSINTYIDVEKAIKQLHLQDKRVIKDYYLEILRDADKQSETHYPYQYSIDNFQLPYLTPDKHRAYALFWGLTTMVGLTAIYKALI